MTITAYGSLSGVEALNAHFVGGYKENTTPSNSEVEGFLVDGYAAINFALAKAGYAVPISEEAAAYPSATRLNNLFAAASAEGSINTSIAGLGEKTRAQQLWEMYQSELKEFMRGDLSLVGVYTSGTVSTTRGARSRLLKKTDGYSNRAHTQSEYSV